MELYTARPYVESPDGSWREAEQPYVAASRPHRRGRLLALVQIGVIVVGVLVVVAVNAAKADKPAPPTGRAAGARDSAATAVTSPQPYRPTPRSTASLPPYEHRQLTVNRSKLSGDLGAIAEPWLAWVSSCRSSLDVGGPTLREGEKTRVVCWYGSVAVYFIRYKTIADRNRVRDSVIADKVKGKALAPGAVGPLEKTSTSGITSGTYVEYAYELTSGEHVGETVCGLWWDDASQPVAGYLLGYWREELGKSWEPLRDVWQRNS